MSRINNKLYLRGRLVRDPIVTEAKDGSGKRMLFGRIAVDQVFLDRAGDTRTRTGYFDLKVFADSLAAPLIQGGAAKGSLVEIEGYAAFEQSEYEDSATGEQRVSHSMVIVLDDPQNHKASVERQPARA